jgi:hypothetical protein
MPSKKKHITKRYSKAWFDYKSKSYTTIDFATELFPYLTIIFSSPGHDSCILPKSRQAISLFCFIFWLLGKTHVLQLAGIWITVDVYKIYSL